VHVKKNGQWLLSSVKDSVFTPPSNYEQLRDLEWAIGEWASENTQGPVEHVSLSWTETRNFIIGSFSTSVKNVSVGSAKQLLDEDEPPELAGKEVVPVAKRARQWGFSGDHGETFERILTNVREGRHVGIHPALNSGPAVSGPY
jgi:hypothetical protein